MNFLTALVWMLGVLVVASVWFAVVAALVTMFLAMFLWERAADQTRQIRYRRQVRSAGG